MRATHHRLRDHFGQESDLNVALSTGFGPYPAGTSVHDVIADLMARVLALESATRVHASFSAEAVIWSGFGPLPDGSTSPVFGHLYADAVLTAVMDGSVTAEAWICPGGSFTVEAVITAGGSFTVSAIIA